MGDTEIWNMFNELGAGDRKKKLVPDRKYCMVDGGGIKRQQNIVVGKSIVVTTHRALF